MTTLDTNIGMNEYQDGAMTTATYEEDPIYYTALGLAGEAGEVANKVKKIIRDDGGELTATKRVGLMAEIGDVLWYCAALAHEIGIPLGDIATANLRKLQNRDEAGTIKGSGDNR